MKSLKQRSQCSQSDITDVFIDIFLKNVFRLQLQMMMPSNGNSFRVTGPLCGEFIGQRQIPLTEAIELWCFLWSAPEQTVEQIIETSVIWDIILLIMMLLPSSDCYTFDVVSQSNSTTQIAEQHQIVINRYLSRHYRCRNQISCWHWMANVRFDNQNSYLIYITPVSTAISAWYIVADINTISKWQCHVRFANMNFQYLSNIEWGMGN